MKHPSEHSVIFKGLGAYLPKNKLTNNELAQMVNTSDEWIRTRTGIVTRHIAQTEEKTSDMCTEAARLALKNAGLQPSDIDLIIVATVTSDKIFPSTATIVQKNLGLGPVPAFDLEAACSGFLYAIDVALSMMVRSATYKNVLVIGGEKLSTIVDWTDRSTCVLFGDAAGAAVLSKVNEARVGIIESVLGADGSNAELLHVPTGGIAMPTSNDVNKPFIKMNGKEVFKHAVRVMEKVARDVLSQTGIDIKDIDCVIPHQANQRIIESLVEHLKLSPEKVFINLSKVGNTSAASIPLALFDAIQEGRIKRGNWVLLVAFGAGLTWASTLIKWH
ncbi:MAG: 3-oxoacyl-ACP synthase [Verrucomicrobia bacterium GWC2_42_7]|nr:MAG: 3-oxoacyl-ACP synthase [Verrucomicrobia bacterium GWC2_42_7]